MSGWGGAFDDPSGGPGGIDPRTGLPDLSYMYAGNKLSNDFTLGKNNYNTGQSHVNNLSKFANSKGPSAWAGMQNQMTDNYSKLAADQVGRDASAAYGGGMSNLASSGGLDAGSRERLASTSGLGRMQNLQNVSGQGNMQKMQTGIADQQMKMDVMKQLPGMQMQQGAFKAGLDQFDVNNNLGMGKMIYGEGVKYQSGQDLAAAQKEAADTAKKTANYKLGKWDWVGGKLDEANKWF